MNTNRGIPNLLKLALTPFALAISLGARWKAFQERRAQETAEALGLRQCSEHPIPLRRNSLSI